MRLRLALLLALVMGAPATAQPSETAVKAAFVPKFARYVDWPPGARASGQPLTLCMIGQDGFGKLIDAAAASEQIDGAPVAVKRFTSMEGVSGCHIAMVHGANDQATAQWLQALAGKPVLTITDAQAGSARGMVHFVTVAGRVRFHIDAARASAQGLTISSRLLALAVSVKQKS